MATITKRELVIKITDQLGTKGHEITQQDVLEVVQTLIDEITDSNIKDSNGVTLRAASPFKGSYYIYEINSEGICKTPGASFVIGAGSRVLSKSATVSAPRVTSAGVRDFGGFVIWRNGSTSVFRSPEQINVDLVSIKAGDDF